MGVNSLPKTRGCDLNSGPNMPESSTLTTRLPYDYVNNTARWFSDVKDLREIPPGSPIYGAPNAGWVG